jgi:predicted aldo/keto reductase-like oxidoreductase
LELFERLVKPYLNGSRNKIACDHADILHIKALQSKGYDLIDGNNIVEKAKAYKVPGEYDLI